MRYGVFQLSVIGFDDEADVDIIGTLLSEMVEAVGGPEKVKVKVLKSSIGKHRLFTAKFESPS